VIDTAKNMKTAQIFPGQGAQHVGMGKDLYEAHATARRVFEEAEAISGLPLRALCFEGPKERLDRTDVAQPAMFTVSAAILAVMHETLSPSSPAVSPAATAGLSLGEYTALYAAEAMDFETTLKLVTRRGAAMQEAAQASEGGMVALIGADEAQAQALCQAVAEGEVLVAANFNCPGQIVLSGAKGACARAAARAKEFGAGNAVVLDVAGAFHSEFMRPAADQLALALEAATIVAPKVPVLANVDARPHEAAAIRARLLEQLVRPVRWGACLEALLADGVERFYEVGAGKVLAGHIKRINRKVNVTGVNSQEAMSGLALES
jgi:[acyl-carrier-protein] S-malonyltransferase